MVCRKGRVKGSEKNTRKVYFITPLGCDHCRKILDGTIPKENLDAAMPQNINYCCSATLWSLPKKERDLIGSFIVLRCPVSRKDFDSEIPGLLPFDDRGRLSIKPETKAWFTQRADTDTLREWHSKAADWCAERNCDPKERLYHLFRSNRRHEAVKLALAQRFMFMDFPDKESRDIIDKLSRECDDCCLRLTAARMSLRLGELSVAKAEAESVDGSNPSCGALISEILLAEGKNAMALDLALDSYVGDIDSQRTVRRGDDVSEKMGGRDEEDALRLPHGRAPRRELRGAQRARRPREGRRAPEHRPILEEGSPDEIPIRAPCWT